jgi:hypothetical protein
MARATLEMFLKLSGADKTSRGLDKVSNSSKKLDADVKNSAKSNAQFSAGMSGLGKTAVAGAAIFASRALVDFARDSVIAASSAQEAAAAFGTTFGDAAADLTQELQRNAQLFGLTTSEAQQLIGVFGAVAQGMGFTQNEAANLSSRLFGLSGDIASFNNISAGAEPVLRAFQSAIVGEREALKTYGIAISEAEVQTKAFSMTGKSSADALTRQEKALATTELLFEKASVQIGNAEREADGFAAQMLQTRAATAELREQIGAELLPAAAELLGGFNNFVDDVAPAVIGAFSLVGDAITTTAELTDKGTDIFTEFIKRYILGQRVIKDEENAVEDFNKAVKENSKILNENSVQIFGSTGFSQDFFNVIADGKKAFATYTNDLKSNRTQVLINTTQTKKYGDEIDKRLNPIFGESNSLLLTNIQLETDRKKLIDLISNANASLAQATQQRNQAAKEVNELQIQENVADAEAAIRKAELLTKIGFLNNALAQGKDVTLDLRLAEAELAEAEFELANDSDRLTLARERLDIAEQNLQEAIENQKDAILERNELLVKSIDLTKEQTTANKNLAASMASIQGTDFGRLVEQGFVSLGAPETTPAPVVAPQTSVSAPATGSAGQEIQITSNVVIEEETIATTIQKVNTKLQQQGKTFQIR